MSSTSRIFAALIVGLGVGVIISLGDRTELLFIVSAAETVGTIWVNAIRMTVIPLVVSLLVTGIASSSPTAVGKVGGRALLLFVVMVAGAALFAVVLAPLLIGSLRIDPAVLAAVKIGSGAPTVDIPSFQDWLTSLIPANPVKAAADGSMLPLIIFTVLFAMALTRTGAEHRDPLVRGFAGVREAMFGLVRWTLVLAPVGVFALSVALAARGGIGLAGALGQFIGASCGLLFVGIVALYPIAVLGGGVPLRRFALACAPAQTVAFSTRSSLAALPAMIEASEHTLGISHDVTGLVLPVAVSLFKFGTSIGRLTGTLFIARLYDIHFGPIAVMALAAALAAVTFYTPGIPSGSLLVMTPVYVAFGLPVEGIGLLLAVDLIPDMFLTTANVTADMTVTVLLARKVVSRQVVEIRSSRS